MRMKPTFGATLRAARISRGYGLREFAAKVGISPTYLSQVERDNARPPTVDRIEYMAELLDADEFQWSSLAGRLPEKLAARLAESPSLTELICEVCDDGALSVRRYTRMIRAWKDSNPTE